MDPVSVAVIDNAEHEREGIRRKVEASEHLVFAGAYASPDEIDFSSAAPRVLLLDLMLGRDDCSSVAAIPELVRWGAVVVLHTNVELPVPLRAAIASGAHGLHLKHDQLPIEPTVLGAANGDFVCSSPLADALLNDRRLAAHLSPRQLEVLTRIADGRKVPSIADELHITRGVVNDHLKAIRFKYLQLGRDVGAGSQALVAEARRDGHEL